MAQALACLGIETSHHLKLVILLDVEVVGSVCFPHVCHGVLAGLYHAVVNATVDVGVVVEGSTGKHVICHHGAAVTLLCVVQQGEGIVEVDAEVLQRVQLGTQVYAYIVRGNALAVSLLDVGNGRTEVLALILCVRIPTRPTHQVEPCVILTRGIFVGLVVHRACEQHVGANLPPVANGGGDVAVEVVTVILVGLKIHHTVLAQIAQ